MIKSRMIVVVTALTALVLPASSTAPAAAAAPLSTVRMTGHGYGHGIGMSQYGAKAAAAAGVPASQILRAYYPSTTLGSIGNPSMRIRLTALDDRWPILLPVSGSRVGGLTAIGWDGRRVTLPGTATAWRIAPARASGWMDVQRSVGRGWGTYTSLRSPVTMSSGALRVSFSGRKATCKQLGEVRFGGFLRFQIVDGAYRSTAIIPMETYLRGVVPSESPASWPAAALQAQAVAARSFAAARRSASRYWDARDSTSDQCWDGSAAHVRATDSAIAATAGQALLSNGVPISAQFSASNGGWQAPGGRAYLPGRRDAYDSASRNSYQNWTVTVSASRLAGLDGPAGLTVVTSVVVTARDGQGDWGGRVTRVVIDGRNAKGGCARITVTGNELRTALGLRSTYFTVG